MTDNRRRALVALGTNLPHGGKSGAVLIAAALRAVVDAGLPLLRVSSAWRTRAWPPSEQPDFVNAAAELDAGALSPAQILNVLHVVERDFGRTRDQPWQARTLDLDLVDLDGERGNVDGIIIPHPRAPDRAFVLAPLSEIAPDWRASPDDPPAHEAWRQRPDAPWVHRMGELPLD